MNSGTQLYALLDSERIDAVVRDCAALVRSEVSAQSGMSGVVIKGGMRVIEKVRPQMIEELFYSLLPRFVEHLEARLTELDSAQLGGARSTLLRQNASEVAEALLRVTDERAERSQLRPLVAVYRKLRPLAEERLVAAVPRLSDLVRHHLER